MLESGNRAAWGGRVAVWEANGRRIACQDLLGTIYQLRRRLTLRRAESGSPQVGIVPLPVPPALRPALRSKMACISCDCAEKIT